MQVAAKSAANAAAKIPGVASYPYIGSSIALGQHKFQTNVHGFLMSNYQEFTKKQNSSIYTLGLPGYGKDIYGTVHMVTDPRDYISVIQKEGKYPSGAVELLWPHLKKNKNSKTPSAIFERGEGWRSIRMLIQRNLLSPKVARGYASGIAEAAQLASDAAPSAAHAFDQHCSKLTFDLFCSALYGRMTKVATPEASPEDLEFCQAILEGSRMLTMMMTNPYEVFVGKTLGIETASYRLWDRSFVKARSISEGIVDEFVQRRESGQLSGREELSYIATTLDYMDENDTGVSREDFQRNVLGLLDGAVDTTAALMEWNVLSMAIYQDAQEKAHAEIAEGLREVGAMGELITKKDGLSYLRACMRETHRMKPATNMVPMKEIAEELTISGHSLKPGSIVIMDGYSVSNDPEVVEDAAEFKPERWHPDAVAARAGTEAEVMDHVLLRGPFSAGARQCPASRVANLEVIAMLATLLKDWRIELDDGETHIGQGGLNDVPYYLGALMNPAPMPKLKFTPRS